jgi:hypothetical protein
MHAYLQAHKDFADALGLMMDASVLTVSQQLLFTNTQLLRILPKDTQVTCHGLSSMPVISILLCTKPC